MAAPILPRFDPEAAAEVQRKLDEILAEIDDARALDREQPLRRSANGHNAIRRRGIPIVGRTTTGGAIAGSDPVKTLLAKERRGELRL